VKVKLHKGQYKVVTSPKRFKVIVAGRRWGKSVLARMWLFKKAMDTPGTYWIVAPTYGQGKEIHWKQGLLSEIPKYVIRTKNEQELEMVLVNGSRIAIRSAENPDRLRGVKLNALVVDEIASIRNWRWLWEEVLRATLTDYESPALFISTPAGYNHFFELYQRGIKGSDKYNEDYESFRFTSYDNPNVPSKEIDKAKESLTEDTFLQEYMAEFKTFTGLVYKEFQREVHVVKPFKIPRTWRVFRGMDFGSNNPTVCLWVAFDEDDNAWIIDEHYEQAETIDFHAGQINAKTNYPIAGTYGDPTGTQWLREFAKRGVHISKANKETGTTRQHWVLYGINIIKEKLKVKPGHFVDNIPMENATGMPSMFIFNNCKNLIHEFESYRWREKLPNAPQDLNEPDTPEKANDHAMDALRYVICSYKGKAKTKVYNQWKPKLWRIGG